MQLSEYGALWFVQQALGGGSAIDPHDEQLPDTLDRQTLARALAKDTDDAGLMVPPDHVRADSAVLAADAPTWQTTFNPRDSLRRAVFGPGVANPQAAFADYIVTRWIFKLVWNFDIRKRPVDRQLPSSYDQPAKVALAGSLRMQVQQIGLDFDNSDNVAAEAARWTWISDVRNSVLKHTVAP
jgi:hypothetical protein